MNLIKNTVSLIQTLEIYLEKPDKKIKKIELLLRKILSSRIKFSKKY